MKFDIRQALASAGAVAGGQLQGQMAGEDYNRQREMQDLDRRIQMYGLQQDALNQHWSHQMAVNGILQGLPWAPDSTGTVANSLLSDTQGAAGEYDQGTEQGLQGVYRGSRYPYHSNLPPSHPYPASPQGKGAPAAPAAPLAPVAAAPAAAPAPSSLPPGSPQSIHPPAGPMPFGAAVRPGMLGNAMGPRQPGEALRVLARLPQGPVPAAPNLWGFRGLAAPAAEPPAPAAAAPAAAAPPAAPVASAPPEAAPDDSLDVTLPNGKTARLSGVRKGEPEAANAIYKDLMARRGKTLFTDPSRESYVNSQIATLIPPFETRESIANLQHVAQALNPYLSGNAPAVLGERRAGQTDRRNDIAEDRNTITSHRDAQVHQDRVTAQVNGLIRAASGNWASMDPASQRAFLGLVTQEAARAGVRVQLPVGFYRTIPDDVRERLDQRWDTIDLMGEGLDIKHEQLGLMQRRESRYAQQAARTASKLDPVDLKMWQDLRANFTAAARAERAFESKNGMNLANTDLNDTSNTMVKQYGFLLRDTKATWDQLANWYATHGQKIPQAKGGTAELPSYQGEAPTKVEGQFFGMGGRTVPAGPPPAPVRHGHNPVGAPASQPVRVTPHPSGAGANPAGPGETPRTIAGPFSGRFAQPGDYFDNRTPGTAVTADYAAAMGRHMINDQHLKPADVQRWLGQTFRLIRGPAAGRKH